MKTLRNTLFVSLTLQVCLAAGIFSAAEEAPLALATLPLALGSLVCIDLLGWLKPPPLLLNLAGLVALGFALKEFNVTDESEGRLNQLLAGGHLIVYLTWTFLLQVKDLRRMWWMFALSLLQVALSAVQTVQPWFGAALFVYTASAVWTMSLLSLTRAALLTDANLLGSDSLGSESVSPGAAPPSRLSFAQNGVRTDEQGRWISPRFLGGGSISFALILVVGMTFFVLTPRVWIGSLNVFGDSPLRGAKGATGFTDKVSLGDIGQIMESNELVMEVDVLNAQTNEQIPPAGLTDAVGDEPLFRGAVLEEYESGSWSKYVYQSGWVESFDNPLGIRLNITLQPMDSEVLFYTGTGIGAQGVTQPDQLYYHSFSLGLERSNRADMGSPYAYSVSSYPPQVVVEPERRLWTKNAVRQGGFSPRMQRLLKTPSTRLTELARQVLDRSDQDGDPDSKATARVLEAYLRDSNEFSYTLDLSVDDPSIDPVEDFVFNRKTGHCEYFASALALMLRGVGIPARLISGFKGAEYDPQTDLLQVRALHAHAWVEAFVDGGWVTFDPTPGLRDTQVASKVSEAAPDLLNQTRSFWFQGMSYSQAEQKSLVYAPLKQLVDSTVNTLSVLVSGDFPLLARIKALTQSPAGWSSWEGAALVVLLVLLASGVVWTIRSLLRFGRRLVRKRELAQRRATTVEFYSRLLKLLQRFGLTDLQTLTPREFAHRAEDQFQSKFRTAGITGTTLALVETFYAVRFGDQPLSEAQLQMVNQQLSQLEQSLVAAVSA